MAPVAHVMFDLVTFIMDEVRVFDADVEGWDSVRRYFESLEDADHHENKGLIATIELRSSLLRQRREQLVDLLRDMGLEEVTA